MMTVQNLIAARSRALEAALNAQPVSEKRAPEGESLAISRRKQSELHRSRSAQGAHMRHARAMRHKLQSKRASCAQSHILPHAAFTPQKAPRQVAVKYV